MKFALAALVCLALVHVSALRAQDEAAEMDAEIARQQQIVDRFLDVLEKNPRRGTALERIYAFHVENGSLDALVKRFQDRVAAAPNDGTAWQILGLIEAQRGRDAAAAEAFAKAHETLPDNALPAYYLGQSLVLLGQTDKAVEAFEASIARKPPRTDLLEIFQSLGRVHQRAQRGDAALAVWTRLETLFPNDASVQEQIAVTLVEEGQDALAVPRYESLIKITKDDYRKSVYRMELADLKVKLNRSAEGVADLENLLASLNPTSWLYREVRRKIEAVFLRTDDQDGLAKYYQRWLEKNPEDIDAMARLARVLARQARVPEATVWLEKALKLAPTRKELRLAFIDQLVDDQRYAEAIAQYQQLDRMDPNNPDYLREWGKLILRDSSKEKEQRLVAAEKVWRKLLLARPQDPLIATQVADLFRHAELADAALELYQKAIEIAPDQPQYREYLGEYYHQLKRPTEALATWRKIAAGKNRTPANLARLAEVLASFGYVAEAIPEMQAACELDPKDFSLQLKAADLLTKAEKYEGALAALTKAEKLAQNEEESAAVLEAQLKVYQLDDSLNDRTTQLAKEIQQAEHQQTAPTARQWYLLARYREVLRQYAEATVAIDAALVLTPKSIPAMATAARIHEQAGNLGKAAELNRNLAVIDRRGRGDYLKHVAQLEIQLGRIDAALAAGRDLIASAPGNTENHEFYADLCFRLGKTDEGLQTLRHAMRVNPTEPKLVLAVATALASQLRTDEAIELYWQAFDKSTDLDGKLGIIPKLVELHLQTNQYDRLLERMERLRRDADDNRELAICLAQVFHSAGDLGMARQSLESLLAENSRDTQLLQQVSKLAEAEGDLASAVKYQEQLVKLAPGAETEYRLATLLSQNGTPEEGAAILVRLAEREEDPEKLLRTVDSLIAGGQTDTALLITQSRLRQDAQNWELLYREGVALAKKPEEAARRFEAILALEIPDETPGIAEKNRRLKAAGKSASTPSNTRAYTRMVALYQIRSAVGLQSRVDYGYAMGMAAGSARTIWGPTEYSHARLASIGWLLRLAREAKQEQAFTERIVQAGEAQAATPRQMWDAYYLATLSSDPDRDVNQPAQLAMAKRLAATGEIAGKQLLLESLQGRMQEHLQRQQTGQGTDSTPPLADEDLALVLEAYQTVKQAADRSAFQSDLTNTMVVMSELKRAGRGEESEHIVQELAAKAKTADELAQIVYIRGMGGSDVQVMLSLFEQWSRLALQDPKQLTQISTSYVPHILSQSMGVSGAAKNATEVLAILDHYLEHNRLRAAQERATAKPSSNMSSGVSQMASFMVSYGRQQRHVQLPFPLPNQYYDQTSLQLLRNAFEVFQRNDALGDLEQHLKTRMERASDADKAIEQLAIAYFHVWNEDSDSALAELTAASQQLAQDAALRMEVARFHIQQQNFEEALELLNGMVATDQDGLRECETLVLDLAVRSGDVDRAKQAAERLFGLRLDAQAQVELADQMRRLGMDEQATAVLARAQRQAGNQAGTLLAVMNSHQSNNQPDQAVQIAHQILRRTRTQPARSRRSARQIHFPGNNEDERTAALEVLKVAGKLDAMIAAAEEQRQRSPNATQLLEGLSELYEAAGNSEKVMELQGKLVELRGDDANVRFAYAARLYQMGKMEEACTQFALAVKRQPQLLGSQFGMIQNAFQQTNKQAELLAILNEIDVRQLGQYHYAVQVVESIMPEVAQRPAAIVLFKKVWEAYPESRAYMVQSLGNTLWTIPELSEYGKQAILPLEKDGKCTPWHGMAEINSYSSTGLIHTPLSGMLDHAASNDQLAGLRAEVAAAMQAHPEWKGGSFLLAMIDARDQKFAAVVPAVESMLDKEQEIPSTALWITAQELEPHEPLRELVIRLYQGAMNATDPTQRNSHFQFGPGNSLLRVYMAANQKEAARAILRKAENVTDDDSYDATYAARQRMEQTINLAEKYEELGFRIDALRLYLRVGNDGMIHHAAGQQNTVQGHYQERVAQSIQKITSELVAAHDLEHIRTLLTLHDASSSAPAIDLMLSISTDTGTPRLRSHWSELIKSYDLNAESSAAFHTQLDELAAQRPDDLSIHITAVLLAHFSHDEPRLKVSLQQLAEAVERTPLEALRPGRRASARQREAAARQIGLWLVAELCLGQKDRAEQGRIFAERAHDAASRQTNREDAAALLLSHGELLLASGDTAAAEARFKQLLETALVRRKGLSAPPVGPAAPATPADGGSKKKRIPPLTLSQFRLAMSVARVSAEHKLTDLALAALQQSFRGGAPVADSISEEFAGQGRIMLSGGGGLLSGGIYRQIGGGGLGGAPQPADELMETVAEELIRLCSVWRQQGLPAEEMYAVLRDVVLPANRPGEILIYPRALVDWSQAESAGLELVYFAVAAKQGPALQEEIAKRGDSPTAKLAGSVLNLFLAVETRQHPGVIEALQTLAPIVETNPDPQVVLLASHAAAVANKNFTDPHVRELAARIFRVAMRKSPDESSLEPNSPLRLLADHYLKIRNFEQLKLVYDDYLNARQNRGNINNQLATVLLQHDLAMIVSQVATAGDARITLEYLGRLADLPSSDDQSEGISLDEILGQVAGQVRALPAAERYVLLRDWTLPTGSRRSFRFMAAFTSARPIPAALMPEELKALGPASDSQLVSSLTLLLDAAREAGELDELHERVRGYELERMPHAEAFSAMIGLARGAPDADRPVQALADRMRVRIKNPSAASTSDLVSDPQRWDDMFLLQAALAHGSTREMGRKLARLIIQDSKAGGRFDRVTHVGRMLALDSRLELSDEDNLRLLQPGLKHWTPGPHATLTATAAPQALWSAHDHHVAHVSGASDDSLYFNYPLTGTFEFSFESYDGDDLSAAVGYGGEFVQPRIWGQTTLIQSLSRNETVTRHWLAAVPEWWNRHSVRVTPESVRFYSNGHLVYEDATPTFGSPWLHLAADALRPTVFRNLKLTGAPTIPREVNLASGDRLEGWAGLFDANLPMPLTANEPAAQAAEMTVESVLE